MSYNVYFFLWFIIENVIFHIWIAVAETFVQNLYRYIYPKH